jgi:WD40 repeat protein/Flp pilus assembly protein TadD
VAGYEILGELGRGAMGVVYKARQTGLDRLVALKMILAGGHAGEQALQRFRTEGRAVAQLHHANVVQIFEVGEAQGLPYFSLEFVGGGSLAQRIAGQPLPTDEAARIVEAVALGVQEAHEHGIVHRDLKPGNILLTADGVPKVADFGLAKQLDDSEGPTGTGAIMGTPAYMAPEQAIGQTRDVGPAADVYALGAVLFHCLTGQPPFRGATVAETLRQVIEHEPVSPRRLNATVDRDLETVCLRALAKEPARRYASAREVADDLRRWLNNEPIRARPPRLPERTWRWCRRNPVPTLAALLIFLIGSIAFALVMQSRGQALRSEADALELAEKNAGLAARNGKLAEQEHLQAIRAEDHSYFHGINLAWREWQGNDIASAERILDGFPTRFRPHWEWRFLKRLCHSDLFTVQAHAKDASAVAFTPDGEQIVTGGADGLVVLWDANTGSKVRELRGHTGSVLAVACSPDGKTIASAGVEGDVRLWDRATGEEQGRLPGYPGGIAALRFSETGNLLAGAAVDKPRGTERGPCPVIVWDVPGHKELRRLNGHAGAVWSVDFGPAEATLVSGGEDGLVRLWSLRTGEPIALFDHPLKTISAVAFSPDGRYVAAVAGSLIKPGLHVSSLLPARGELLVWDVTSNRRVLDHTESGSQGGFSSVAFAPDGAQLAVGSASQAITVGGVLDGQRAILRGHTAAVAAVCFSPEGNRVASVDQSGRLKVWDQVNSGESRILRGYLRHFNALAISPDGRWVATGDNLRRLRIWETETGRARFTQKTPSGTVCLAFHPDGKRLAAGHSDGTVTLLEAPSGRSLQSFPAHGEALLGLAFSPDGAELASSANDHRLRVWNASTGRRLRDLEVKVDEDRPVLITNLAYRPDGKQVALASGVGVLLLDWPSGKLSRRLQVNARAAWSVAYSPDGVQLAAGGLDGDVRCWHLAENRQTLVYENPGRLSWSVDFSPDGRLAAISSSGELLLWDPARGERLLSLPRNGISLVPYLSFSRSAPWLATVGGYDVELWNAGEIKGSEHLVNREVARERSLGWHEREAEAAEMREQWFAMMFHLRHLIRATPDDALLHARLGRGQGEIRAYPAALKTLGRAIELAPGEARGWYERGVVQIRRRAWDEAIQDLTSALDRDPENESARAYRGVAHAEKEEWQLAEKDLEGATRSARAPAGVLLQLALVRLQLGDVPGYRRTCLEMVRRYAARQVPAEVVKVVQTCVVVPEALEDWSPLLRPLDGLARSASDRYLEVASYGQACYRAGDYPGARQWLTHALKSPVEDPLSSLFLAMTHHRLGDTDQARRWLERFTTWLTASKTKREGERLSAWEELSFSERLRVEHLSREARELLAKPPAP